MRSFSNIMPNFADKLHLLVDSIKEGKELSLLKKITESLWQFRDFSYFCIRSPTDADAHQGRKLRDEDLYIGKSVTCALCLTL